MAWHTEPSRSRSGQNELPHALAVAQRKLLRERTAPRHSEHVHRAIAEHVERPDHELREAAKAARKPSRFAVASSGDVDRDRLRVRERPAKGIEELERGADAVQQEQ